MFTSFNLVKNFFITVEYNIKICLFWAGFFSPVFLRWVYPKKPTGFFGYVPGCPNPGDVACFIHPAGMMVRMREQRLPVFRTTTEAGADVGLLRKDKNRCRHRSSGISSSRQMVRNLLNCPQSINCKMQSKASSRVLIYKQLLLPLQWGNVITSVLVFVCLFVCEQHYETNIIIQVGLKKHQNVFVISSIKSDRF